MPARLLPHMPIEHGFARAALAVVALLVVVAVFAGASLSSGAGGRDLSAEKVALTAAAGAQVLAGEAHGSYSAIGALALSRVTHVPVQPVAQGGWLSAVAGRHGTFTLTATDEPSGDTFTVTRDDRGTVTRTCHVAGISRDGSRCERLSAAGDGVW